MLQPSFMLTLISRLAATASPERSLLSKIRAPIAFPRGARCKRLPSAQKIAYGNFDG